MTKLMMSLFAQLDGLNPLQPTVSVGKSTGLLFKDVMAIIVTGLVLALILVLWARYYMRRRKHRQHHHANRNADPLLASQGTPPEYQGEETSRGRRRRRRRDHRSRNPTLAETGGLPPAKPEGPSASCQ